MMDYVGCNIPTFLAEGFRDYERNSGIPPGSLISYLEAIRVAAQNM